MSLEMAATQQKEGSNQRASSVKVDILGVHPIGMWRWEMNDDADVCGICRMPYHACCPGAKFPGDDCPPVWGKCGHAFHVQCIMKWVNSESQQEEPQCPMCRQTWEFK
eukprot:gb/GECG01013483.1/.p1 GENE.gb/GECG01013483.1/~~gb/GECG01013483.1/.p1  ORF type:complete len:108 (+),score=10.31 gb/GECG01013483.1/:1-324(+)